MSCLVVISGREKGRTYQVAADRDTVIGRVLECDVCLADGRVSRRNTAISIGQSGFFVKDMGSANGTYLNGARTAEAQLKDGDKVRVGTTEMEFHQTERFEDAPTKRVPGGQAAGAAAPAAPVSFMKPPSPPARKMDTQSLEFCSRCSGSVSAAALAAGAARRQGAELVCSECAAKEKASRDAAPADVLRLAEEVAKADTATGAQPVAGGGDDRGEVISLDDDDVPRLDGKAAAASGATPLPDGKE
jgi:predicted component of type VI protein secretion system